MSEPDRLLAELWAQDEPPELDPAFVVQVMGRAARRRFWLGLAALAPVVVAASAVLWALAPMLQQLAAAALPVLAGPTFGGIAAALVMAGFLWCWASGRLQPLDI